MLFLFLLDYSLYNSYKPLVFTFSPAQKQPVKASTDKDPTVFKVHKIFKILEEAMLDDKENLIEKVRGIYCFKVTNSSGKEGMWIIDAKNGKGSVTFYGKGMDVHKYTSYVN